MLKIELTTHVSKLTDVRAALEHSELLELLVMEAKYATHDPPRTDIVRGVDCATEFVPCVRVEAYVGSRERDVVIDLILRAAMHERLISDTITVSEIKSAIDIVEARPIPSGTHKHP